MENLITVWITKYALSTGIMVEQVEEPTDFPNMVHAKALGYGAFFHGEGKDWHRTERAALDRAETMRKAKIASLQKQIAKLEKKRF